MNSTRQWSIHLFRFAGIDLYLHWSWFLVAAFEIGNRTRSYSSISWNVLEYLALFFIVMMHEFGHALACRQVGGTANRIMLWPLGGVAYVNPPPRPGATLWSIAAGPLVNVVLLLVLSILAIGTRALGWPQTMSDAHTFLRALWLINLGLLVFNMLPIYPLDGGQILRSLLWFVVGRARSLMAAAVIGLIGVAGFILLALWVRSFWFGLIAVFILSSCWNGFRQAQALLRLAKLPSHEGFACPACKAAPPVGALWKCSRCGQPFDTFQTRGVCPRCASQVATTQCRHCGSHHPMSEWIAPAPVHAN